MKLKPLSLVAISLGLILCGSGCHMFGKSKKKAEGPIAEGVESDFRQRWLDRRTAELTAQGRDATTARTEAESEFREKYPFLKTEKK